MLFLQLVLTLDKTGIGVNSIFRERVNFDRYRNISFSLKNEFL